MAKQSALKTIFDKVRLSFYIFKTIETIESKLSKQVLVPQLCIHLDRIWVQLYIHVCFTGQLRLNANSTILGSKTKLTKHKWKGIVNQGRIKLWYSSELNYTLIEIGLGIWNPLACLKVHKNTKKRGFGILQNWHGRVIRTRCCVIPYRRPWHGRVI